MVYIIIILQEFMVYLNASIPEIHQGITHVFSNSCNETVGQSAP